MGDRRAWSSRYGPDDERGTLNEITAAEVVARARLVQTGRVYDLDRTLHAGVPRFEGRFWRQTLVSSAHLINGSRPGGEGGGWGKNRPNWITELVGGCGGAGGPARRNDWRRHLEPRAGARRRPAGRSLSRRRSTSISGSSSSRTSLPRSSRPSGSTSSCSSSRMRTRAIRKHCAGEGKGIHIACVRGSHRRAAVVAGDW